jgi:hypothetical protein
MFSEKQRIEWQETTDKLETACKEATKAFALLSLVLSGIKINPEEIDILNAEIIEKD